MSRRSIGVLFAAVLGLFTGTPNVRTQDTPAQRKHPHGKGVHPALIRKGKKKKGTV